MARKKTGNNRSLSMTKTGLRKTITELARIDVDLKTLCSIVHETLDKY